MDALFDDVPEKATDEPRGAVGVCVLGAAGYDDVWHLELATLFFGDLG